ncbi:hypothetical protein EUGRSUZ_K03169 [Eucalyptus grandis]|uniref:Tify domain-containing protein n=4 Tax=Eucalyptus grandis TaxID=71139 RepID=A0A059A6C3_EUCGR|nr:hypothetical protein EUGRSUZ_K03169 [Eucalyptus grandis]KAK3407045.1 hypothetical protein EUGRSUZ_K03169 [Eucalyptus grandis]KAK3407046.1 hypothetical protein EUGRSUZ_K03169 [Eucalyptus grandis]
MSFQNQGFWTGKDASGLTNSEMAYDNTSRIEAKWSQQWFMDGPEAEHPNKKQAIEVPSNTSFLGLLSMNSSPWGFTSGFNTVSAPAHFSDQVLDTETTGAVKYNERCNPSIGAEKLNMGRKVDEDLFPSNSSFGLSMSHVPEAPGSGLNYGSLRKVKVNHVKDSENVTPSSMGHGYNRVASSAMFTTQSFCKEEEDPVSTALASGIGDGNIISSATSDLGESNSVMSIGKLYENEGESAGQAYKGHGDAMSVPMDNNVLSMGQSYKADDCSMSTGHIYGKGHHISVPAGNIYNNDDSNSLNMCHSYGLGQSTIISFGSPDNDDANSSRRLIYSNNLYCGLPSVQTSDAVNSNQLIKSNADMFPSSTSAVASGIENFSRKKEEQNTSKKGSNNFPSNVRSLLSTGILDGISVKYAAWSREKELRGVIRGSGYLCGCQSCNFTKVINAYEFERHAGCKTKHPNNHIYFDNGKTIYGIVQELRSTPQNMLFEVMQTITGSPINQKSFRLWKESYLAATRELQRIYGED